jgi:hypothetical protein
MAGAKKKYKWSPFTFVTGICNQRKSPDEKDFHYFVNHLTALFLSCDEDLKYMAFARGFNLRSFYKLPKEQQCRAYGTFQGYGFKGGFVGVKKNQKYANDETLEKIMWAFNCNRHRAKAYSQDKRLDMEEIIAEYNEHHGIYD